MQRTEENERRIKELRARIEKVEKKEKQLESLNRQVDDLEWCNRRYNLEFRGIPQTKQDDLVVKINDLAAQNELPKLSRDDVAAIHRLPLMQVRFRQLFAVARSLASEKHCGTTGIKFRKNKKVRVLQNLTKALLREVKDWAKENYYKHVWHRNHKIMVTKAEVHLTIHISDFRDVAKLT